MRYYFKKGKNATEMQKKKKICAVFGEGAVAEQYFILYMYHIFKHPLKDMSGLHVLVIVNNAAMTIYVYLYD